MPIFHNNSGKLIKLNASLADKERKLQKLVEGNLQEVLDLIFLETEYVTTFGGRIDTLAVDMNGAPVIIEYKKNSNDNIINQGLSYLKWLKAQKVEFFEMLIQKKNNEALKNLKVDWKNPRVICIAENYSKFDRDTVEVVSIKIELYKYRFYENNIFSLELIDAQEKREIITTKEISPQLKETTKPEIVELNHHLDNSTTTVIDCFNEFRSRILSIDDTIIEKISTFYIAYKVSKNFAEVHIKKKYVTIYLRPLTYNDPKGLVQQVPETYRWTLDRRVSFKSLEEIDYIMSLIEQSYTNVL